MQIGIANNNLNEVIMLGTILTTIFLPDKSISDLSHSRWKDR